MSTRRYDYPQPAPINFFSEDFIAGFQPSNRMSVVRRFFCLFITFDLLFVALLWLICVVITGENVYKALEEQVVHYTIEQSLFDVVAVAIARFIILMFFYAIIQINHWSIIALTTSTSCSFLIAKVFYYDWPSNQQPFQVFLIIISFVISWFEAWFLDSRMIPQEEYSRTLTQALNSSAVRESTPLLAPFLQSLQYRGNSIQPPESYRRFYSPVESVDNSDDEDDEYRHLGVETVIKAYELLESTSWKVEKVTSCKDTIYTTQKQIGKVYKLKAKVNYSAEKLLYELFYNIEDVPKWNPTLLESKVIKKIDSNTDISYSVSPSGGGGIVKSRDFVNLRCWKLMNDSRVIEDYNIHSSLSKLPVENHSSYEADNEKSRDEDEKSVKTVNEKLFKKSASDAELIGNQKENDKVNQLSKSLGAVDMNCVSDDDEPFADAETEVQNEVDPLKNADAETEGQNGMDPLKNVFVSAAMSIEYSQYPATTKYIRGENIVSCWAMRPIAGDDNSCFFEWVLCLDLKGSLPKYVLNTAFVSLMTDYMIHLRNRIEELNEQDKESNEHQPC